MHKLLIQCAKYAGVSAAALIVDVGLLQILVQQAGLDYRLANGISFLAGAAIAYILSVKLVFAQHRLHNRTLEFASFVGLGLVGLGINEGVLYWDVEVVHTSLGFAKVCAAGCTFLANFILRRQLLFQTKHTVDEGLAPDETLSAVRTGARHL